MLEITMSLSMKNIFLLCMLMLVWVDSLDLPRVKVSLTNNLEGKEDLNVHCKSKDDDLGQHLLHINQTFDWSFGPKFWGGTLFFCSFQWGKSPLLYLDAYVEKKDTCEDCHWYIHKDGPCRFEPKILPDPGQPPPPIVRRCYNWKR